jgi:excinuclease ABC subunit C
MRDNDPQDTQELRIERLTARVRAMPEMPGVYLMKDESGAVIYVGKAISLRARVRSYFNNSDTRAQVQHLLDRIDDIDIIVTEDERQALVLEIDLIQKFKPRYNIRLKDDKSPLMVRLDMNSEWPRLELVRRREDDGARYFGPYPFRYELSALLDVIDRALPIRTCTDRVMKNRVRPCLQHQIKRCAAPCCLPVDVVEYESWIGEAVQILEGDTQGVIDDLHERMQNASDQLRYEDAALLRDRVQILEKVQENRASVFYGEGNVDALCLYREGSSLEVSILRAWNGKLSEGESFGFTDVSVPDKEVLSSVLSQFYSSTSRIPEEVLLPFELEEIPVYERILTEKLGQKVSIKVPRRGLKSRLMDLARVNAKENFEGRFSSEKKQERILESLRETLDLDQVPRVIECVDISHIQGASTVGAVVCFKDGLPEKSRYRYFHLSQEGKPDDFASMNETVRRHLSRCMEEGTLCDLMVIDGGPPQIAQARSVRKELGLTYPVIIALAKKRDVVPSRPRRSLPTSAPRPASARRYVLSGKPERIYIEDTPAPLVLPSENEVLKLLERIRDETHRSAVTFHRKTRSRKQFSGPLDKISGLGPKRKQTLLREFGSIARIRKSSIADLVQRGGLPEKLAERVLSRLNDDEFQT